ncbi:MAG: hypothetical protein CO090_02865 [Acidobacteria bacterium CG_4_9_14_3_um_filter_49_7]|nr:MAG: hypothetical protein CO090_02865 [Acidobacteria bacterium CG_4_9_14_3_um_filter_49_7]
MIAITGTHCRLPVKGQEMSSVIAFESFYSGKVQDVIINEAESAATFRELRQIAKNMKRTFSHVAILQLNNRSLLFTDSFVHPEPDISTLSRIVGNSAFVAGKMGIDSPKISILSAVEVVSLQMESAVPAAVMEAMGSRKQFGPNVRVEGPLSMDVSLSPEAAAEKHVNTVVAGKADVLVGHRATIAQGIFKTLRLFAKPQSLISVVTDGKNLFPMPLKIMSPEDIRITLNFCNVTDWQEWAIQTDGPVSQ